MPIEEANTVKTLCRTNGTHTSFILADLDPAYHQTALDLVYEQVEEGFARIYPADTPHLDIIYDNFARFAEEMMLQTARDHPVPWEHALLSLLQRIDGQGIHWFLGGSAALAARGLDIQPRDFDMIVAEADAQRLGDVLLDELIEPVLPVEKILPAEEWFCNWWGRAFLGARVEWVGGVDERADTPDISDFGPTAADRLETITWRGYSLHVPPLDLQLAVSERRGLTERAAKIRRVLDGRL
ncbi:MAG TPA: hypothetical protein VKT82_03675 [Ktedonobacterales bacterium]|nr:hypothetical protein [Ktedonobacterales bacterium]